jgi:hypothetical protein
MKSRKLIILLIFTAFCMDNALAQAHTFNVRCKLIKRKKGAHYGDDFIDCPVCKPKEIKEREAKKAEVDRIHEIHMAKVNAENIARDKARKAKLLEDAKNAHSGEVLINGNGNLDIKKSSQKEIDKYTVENSFVRWDDNYFKTKCTVKILEGGKVIYESNEHAGITIVYGTKLFTLSKTSNLPRCVAENSNRSFFINHKGENVTLPGIGLFGFTARNRENDDYFEVVVYTGNCTPVERNMYDWHTISYVFSKKDLQLISSGPSWMHGDCECQ